MFLPFQKLLHFIQSVIGELQQTIILYNHEQFIFQNTFFKAEVSTSCVFRRTVVIFTKKKVKANGHLRNLHPVNVLWHSLPYVLYLFSILQYVEDKVGINILFHYSSVCNHLIKKSSSKDIMIKYHQFYDVHCCNANLTNIPILIQFSQYPIWHINTFKESKAWIIKIKLYKCI